MNLEKFACPNTLCTEYGKRGAGNVTLYTRYGRKHVRLLLCKTCTKTFSELKGTPFWDSRLDWDTIEKIYRSLLDGQGIRATARIHGLSKNTVKRYLRLAKKDFSTVSSFLKDRGVVSESNEQLRDLVDKLTKRATTLAAATPM